jgi:hypothetical protein
MWNLRKQKQEILQQIQKLKSANISCRRCCIKSIINQNLFKWFWRHEIVENGKIAIEKLKKQYLILFWWICRCQNEMGLRRQLHTPKQWNLKFNNCFNRCNQSRCSKWKNLDSIPKPINENLLYSKIVELVKGNNNYWCAEFDNERNTRSTVLVLFRLQTVVKQMKFSLNNLSAGLKMLLDRITGAHNSSYI